jgi:hypothetical protein
MTANQQSVFGGGGASMAALPKDTVIIVLVLRQEFLFRRNRAD